MVQPQLWGGLRRAPEAKTAGFFTTIAEAKAAGYVEGLKAAGYTCAEAKAAGYTLQEIRMTGYTYAEARTAGYTKLKAAGYTCAEAKAARLTCAGI